MLEPRASVDARDHTPMTLEPIISGTIDSFRESMADRFPARKNSNRSRTWRLEAEQAVIDLDYVWRIRPASA